MARNVKMYLYQRYSGKKLKEIGVHFGVGESRVSQSSRRVAEKIELYRKLERKVAGLEKRINSSRMKAPPFFPCPSGHRGSTAAGSTFQPGSTAATGKVAIRITQKIRISWALMFMLGRFGCRTYGIVVSDPVLTNKKRLIECRARLYISR